MLKSIYAQLGFIGTVAFLLVACAYSPPKESALMRVPRPTFKSSPIIIQWQTVSRTTPTPNAGSDKTSASP
jgi:hypothetical protein